ncbi:hypothetical protein N7493_008384 [Penicillium malachiteum]|uniref:ATP-dependent DNA helicase II subunit 1 n=1 Tax=Penicillium malachiteum TaxID=1324776 RepID=A0AAD6MTR3_9EURO|nr:hypothetical protein N7493_008384 [Penicillium malachiteum]
MADDSNTHEEELFEEEEVDETNFRAVKDAVLFAIDISSSMLTPRPSNNPKKPGEESPASAALKCAYHLMQQRIISNPKDMMGVLLYGTRLSKSYDADEESGADLSHPHCYLFTDLNIPLAQDVKDLRALAENDEEFHKILQPSDEPVSMANVLFCANQIFTSRASNFLSRRLFIVTDNDNPHANNEQLRKASAVRARDLYDLGVTIELFPISRPDQEFDTSKYYYDIIYKAEPCDGEAPVYLQRESKSSAQGDGIELLNSLLSSINSRSVAKRSLFSKIPLEIGPNLKVSVNGYLLLKRQQPARSCYVWLGGETPEIAQGTTALLADDTAHTVEKSETRKAYKFGGGQVYFTPDELTVLRDFGEPVIRIIGFKSLDSLPIWANVKHPTFIYPTEEDYIGSTRVFSALQQKLLKDNKLALVWFIPRKKAVPVLGAMIAGDEQIDENGIQKLPPGMWIIPLPFADDVRKNPPGADFTPAPEPLIDAMKEVLGQLQLPKGVYDPVKYPNPSLQWHYRILQAIALDEDLPEQPDDKTIPKYRQIDKRAGEYVLKWSAELDAHSEKLFGGSAAPSSTLVKRGPRASTDSDQPAKRVKVEIGASDVDGEIKKNMEKGTLSKLTVAILKEFLTSHGRSAAGKKADLIERVEQYFEEKS